MIVRIGISGMIVLVMLGCNTSQPPVAKKKKKSRPPVIRVEPIDPADRITDRDQAEQPESTRPRQQFRPDDRRPVHDDEALARAGIQVYESKRLKLYTDIEPEIAEKLPPIVDRLYDAHVEYFGPLPLDRQGEEFQITGYIMRDEQTFREAGLLENVPAILHGRHIANRFWMRHQATKYFTEHLMLHECTHCYMTFVPGYMAPLWYMEGMAELFATHHDGPDGEVQFCVMPSSAEEVPDWGRIPLIRKDVAAGRGLTLRGVEQLGDQDFFQPPAYAWSWALCYFLDANPRYHDRFRVLSQHLRDGEFATRFEQLQADDHFRTQWQFFIQDLQYGYDLPLAAVELSPAPQPLGSQSHEMMVAANRGWQDAGVVLKEGTSYEITATGQFTLASEPKPWICEPQGVTLDYFNGEPLGKLVACVEKPASENGQRFKDWKVIPIGKQRTFTAPSAGRLFLRVNDAWNALEDNSGSLTIHLRRAE